MNKRELSEALSKECSYSSDMCYQALTLYEESGILFSKEKAICSLATIFEEEFSLTNSQAEDFIEKIYSLLRISIHESLKHPFRRKD